MRKIWDFHGGVHPAENKTQSTQSPIAKAPLPSEIVLPLNQHIGAPAQPIVGTNDHVLKGQKVAEALGRMSVPVHASTSGKVIAIEERPIAHVSGMSALCIVIEPDGLEQWVERHTCDDFTQLSKHEILQNIRDAGIAGMGGAGFPSAVKLDPRADHTIDTLILNGTECEPYITADDMLMRERANEIIEGAKLLAFILKNPQHILIGIEDNKPEAIQAMRAAAESSSIEVVVFPTKYPSGGEKQLIQILTSKEVPSGKLPADIGIVVQNIGTAVAAWRAVKFGEPLISRVTTFVGRALKQEKNLEVLIGTPIEQILTHLGWQKGNTRRMIIGGPMMGFALENTQAPIVKTTNCVITPSLDEIPEQPQAQPCIRCGMCSEACPASLLPQQLFWFSQAEEFEKLSAHNIFDCIECGACSYVCPSNIPLVQYYRHSKSTMRQLDAEKQKADRSRERFESRKARIAKAEAEKEAKRQARKKAAQEAKEKLSENNIKAEPTQPSEAKTALVTPKKPPANHPQEPARKDKLALKEKLERNLASAKSFAESAAIKLNEGKIQGDFSRIESLEAQKKQAEFKLIEAQSKLAQFEQDNEFPKDEVIKNKIRLSPIDKHEANIATIEKRLNTAQSKLAEAEANQAPTLAALQNGVDKLTLKLKTAKQELDHIKLANFEPDNNDNSPIDTTTTNNAAERAIAKAKLKAEQQTQMTEEEKKQAQRIALETRLKKAKDRLTKAKEENNENMEAYENSVAKLETKIAALDDKDTRV